jgi:hypothetical protein
MTSSKNRVVLRSVSIGASILLGSALAFLLGARAGANLDHRTRTVTIAHTPQQTAPAHVAAR